MITISSVVFNLSKTLKPSWSSRGACWRSKSQSFWMEVQSHHANTHTHTHGRSRCPFTRLAPSHPVSLSPFLSVLLPKSAGESRENVEARPTLRARVCSEVGHQAPGRRKWGRFYLKELYFRQPILQGFINQRAPLWTAGSGLKLRRHREALWLFKLKIIADMFLRCVWIKYYSSIYELTYL